MVLIVLLAVQDIVSQFVRKVVELTAAHIIALMDVLVALMALIFVVDALEIVMDVIAIAIINVAVHVDKIVLVLVLVAAVQCVTPHVRPPASCKNMIMIQFNIRRSQYDFIFDR